MWYDQYIKPKSIRTDKAIFAKSRSSVEHPDGNIYVLMHHTSPGRICTGYDWFNIKKGTYNSDMYWNSPELAMAEYESQHEIFNGSLEAKREDK